MITRIALVFVLLAAAVQAQVLGAPSGKGVLRPPAGAGSYYPAEPYALQQAVRRFMNEAPGNAPLNRLLAVVVPHAPLGLAGHVMGAGFKHLQPGQYDRVIVLGPSQNPALRECSIADVEAFVTPLGLVPVDLTAVDKICYSPFIKTGKLDYRPGKERVHEKNMSIEAVLPFLQERIGVFRLVPIVVGDLMTPPASEAAGRIEAVAKAIREISDNRTLLVVTCNFTHYGEAFGYAPFQGDVAAKVKGLDDDIFARILAQDGKSLATELRRTQNRISGLSSIMVLLKLMPDSAGSAVVAYDTSGRKTGHWENSLSFGTILFNHPKDPQPESRPERRLAEIAAPVALPEAAKEESAPPVEPAPAEAASE